ncbi:hypothetical protein GA0074692_5333 [Micromonospora pallida]|uniref:Uncharacterized protein n=1 Tax=Micromonospora pallida TaxID=145854 RepID=A0A1C6TCS0_9ACTN|nr:hypothetical protein [Micromonospora pallida]SCL39352.1 hypothetical protein GA0074692_5333 [Micromonospora pallida]
MTIRDTTVKARVQAEGNAVAQVVLTLQCRTDKPWCRERVTVTHKGETIDSKQVTIEADATRELTLNFRGPAREALRAGPAITLDVQIGDATSHVTVTP